MIALLLGCDPTPIAASGPPPTDPPACNPVPTWSGDIDPFLATWCLACHSSALPEEARHGAPAGMDFDDPDVLRSSADAIASAVSPASARMPPAGGPSDEERMEVVDWIACGLPDLPDPAVITDPCAEPSAVAGDLELSARPCATSAGLVVHADLRLDADEDASCVCDVLGSLVADGATTATLSRLAHVGGNVQADGAIGAVSLPLLTRVDGSVRLEDTPLALFHAARLATVGGELRLARAPLLASVDVARLEETEGSVVVDDIDALADMDRWTGLERVNGDVLLRGNAALGGDAPLVRLESVDGRVEVSDNAAMAWLDGFVSLTSAAEVALVDLPNLTSVGGLKNLASGAILFERLDALEALPTLGAMTVATSVVLRDTASLIDLVGLDALVEVDGDLVIERCDAMTSTWGAGALTRIGGDLVIDDLPALGTLSLPVLSVVEGDVVLRDLPMLEASQALALVAQLDEIGGTVVIEGVGP